ncbi:unnamed protein product [Oppiella nova]|uniref:Uncharacterized protein n=1 Tax=Oppiella nova TaxID=334625 RepID=A0A7R9QA41_9ACAR|nr:unnamed protein product [Oppiella nova]CAG2159779.1 unnamed protein product [Oppiella nova]
MAEGSDQSVADNGMSTAIENGVIESSSKSQKFLMSAALVVDAKDGLLLLTSSMDYINVKLYLLYRHWFCQYLLYLTITLHHLLVLFESTSDRNYLWINSLEIICLLIYTTRLCHLFVLTPSSVFWSDKKNVIVVATTLITFCDIIVSFSVNHYIRWTPVLRPLFIINFAENKEENLQKYQKHITRCPQCIDPILPINPHVFNYWIKTI